MRAAARIAVVAAAAALFAGCSDQGTLVVVTIDSSMPLAEAASLHLTASAGTTARVFDIPVAPEGIPPAHSIGIQVPPSVTGTFSVHVDAIDSSGAEIASGAGQTTLQTGKRVDIQIDLTGDGTVGGGDLGGEDLGGGGEVDMTTPALAVATPKPYAMVRQAGSVDVAVSVTRGPGVSGDVTITFSNLPGNVTVSPSPLVIPDGQTQGAFTLSATPQAAQGGPTAVTLTGSTGAVMGSTSVGVLVAGGAGSRDQSFGTMGATIVDFPTMRYDICTTLALTPAVQPIVGGISEDPNNLGPTDLALAQLNTLGALDSTFGTNGIRQVHPGDTEQQRALLVQPDGKIVIVGALAAVAGNYDVLVVRLNPNGTVDGTFGTAGVVTVDMGGNNDVGGAVALQKDGKIVVAGGQFASPGTAFVLRLNTNGTLDTTFGSSGKLVLPALGGGGYDLFRAVAIRSDGAIVAGGVTGTGTTEDALVARITPAGALDTTFGGGGKTITNGQYGGSDVINALALNADDSIIAAGHAQVPFNGTNQADFAVFRYSANGALDTTFGQYGGISIIDWNHLNDDAFGVAIQPADGKIVVTGNARQTTGQDNGIVRLDATGMLDNGFGMSGKADIDLKPMLFDGAFQVALQPDGRIVVGGYIDDSNGSNNNYDCTVIRLWP